MGTHMLPGRERWRALRRSIRFTTAMILAIPILAAAIMWIFAGVTLISALANHSSAGVHGTVLIRIAVADAIGLAAILVAAASMAWFARRLSRDASALELSARRFADQQLPQLVERVRRGDAVEPDGELYASARMKVTELSRAAAALASVQRTALAAASTETSLRSGISQVFVSLARRSQSLLQRQLRLLDELERKAVDPGALADLFPLDHLTTRMRRHAEGLIILSGAVPGRAWSNPVPVIDVIRGAIAEVEDYKRIAVVTTSEDMVAGSAVADMIHLLAELIENAALFSPSGTRVEVKAERVGNGFAFEIEDRGLGIKPDELDAINLRLGSPADFDLANADQLGLFVVGKLAARHAVRVFLRPSPYGGTTAIVLMPITMIAPASEVTAGAKPADALAAAGHDDDLHLALTGRSRRPPPSGRSDAPGLPGALTARAGVFAGQPDTDAFPSLPDIDRVQPDGLHAGPDAGPDLAGPAPGEPDGAPGEKADRPSERGDRPGEPAFFPSQPTLLGQPVFPDLAGPGRGQPASADLAEPSRSQPVFPDLAGPSRSQPVFPDLAGPSRSQPVFPDLADPGRSDPVFPDLAGPSRGEPVFTNFTGSGRSQPGAEPEPPARPGPPGPGMSAGTHRGLPRRVRQANLSPHLRNSPSAGTAASFREPAVRSPEQAQSLLASLQRGWERGREAEVPDADSAANGKDSGDSARGAAQEES
jgi:signal transduction histidine kinase